LDLTSIKFIHARGLIGELFLIHLSFVFNRTLRRT